MVVDDLNLVRLGFKNLIEQLDDVDVIAEISSGEEAIKFVKEKDVDVIVMDINMPGMGGIEATKRINRLKPNIKILIVTAYTAEVYPARLLKAGASGFITKNSSLDSLHKAIHAIAANQQYVSPDVAQSIAIRHLSHSSLESPVEKLSERELQIVTMIVQGKSVDNISSKLCLSKKTVHSYRYRVFEKLGIDGDVQLTHMAIRHGLVDVVH